MANNYVAQSCCIPLVSNQLSTIFLYFETDLYITGFKAFTALLNHVWSIDG